jgi:hypothetical protein
MSARTRIALAAVAAALSIAAAVSPASAGVLDQQQISLNNSLGVDGPTFGAGPGFSEGQTFRPSVSGWVDRVDLAIRRSAGNEGPVIVEIRDVDSLGRPGPTVLASGTLPGEGVPISPAPHQFMPVPLTSTGPVVADEQYAIVAYVGGSDHWGWGAITAPAGGTDHYDRGRAVASATSPPITWLFYSGVVDMAFKTYMRLYEPTGFFAPIDNTNTNVAKAGQTVPMKWRVTDSEGNPVSDPAHFDEVSSTGDNCEAGPTDEVETYSGNSGLQYLGDGNWQFNWKTPKDYAGQCRTLTLRLSDGGTLTADFKFKK